MFITRACHMMEEDRFKLYSVYLKSEFSPDYWSDEALGIAAGYLHNFSGADWERLCDGWDAESSEWKVRCAETLDADLTKYGQAILTAMLHDIDIDVVITAADSLRSWPSGALCLGHSEVAQLANVAEGAGPLGKLVLESLLAHIVR